MIDDRTRGHARRRGPSISSCSSRTLPFQITSLAKHERYPPAVTAMFLSRLRQGVARIVLSSATPIVVDPCLLTTRTILESFLVPTLCVSLLRRGYLEGWGTKGRTTVEPEDSTIKSTFYMGWGLPFIPPTEGALRELGTVYLIENLFSPIYLPVTVVFIVIIDAVPLSVSLLSLNHI